MTTPSLDLVAARQLRDALASLLRREQSAMADFLVALADFDRRRGWELLGHASLFAFLHGRAGALHSATFWRMSAARLLQRFPEVIEPLRRRPAVPVDDGGAGQGADRGEPGRGASSLLRPLGAGGEGARGRVAAEGGATAPRGRDSAVATVPRPEPARLLASPALARPLTPRRSSVRTRVDRHVLRVASGVRSGTDPPRAGRRPPRRRRAAHRRPPPAAHHGGPPVPEDGRDRPRRPLALHPRRQHRAGAEGRARAPAREAGAGAGAGEAAAEGRATTTSTDPDPAPQRGPRQRSQPRPRSRRRVRPSRSRSTAGPVLATRSPPPFAAPSGSATRVKLHVAARRRRPLRLDLPAWSWTTSTRGPDGAKRRWTDFASSADRTTSWRRARRSGRGAWSGTPAPPRGATLCR